MPSAGTSHAIRRRAPAFTIVELLVAIFILGVVTALLVPAIQAARESARRSDCKNRVRQLSLAVQHHVEAQGHFPTGGWGGTWVGDADRGFGPGQPGGWIFNILPYMEEQSLHKRDANLTGRVKAAAIASRLQTVLPLLHCPSRRRAALYPHVRPFTNEPRQSMPITQGARTDYAMCSGDHRRCDVFDFGPKTLEEGDSRQYVWTDMRDATGISFLRSYVRMAHVTDGATKTYMLGEKSLDVESYATGLDHGDDWTAYTGYQDDIYRTTFPDVSPQRDPQGPRGFVPQCGFGSPHKAGFNMAFCDGSVRLMSYTIAPELHRSLGNRIDGAHASADY